MLSLCLQCDDLYSAQDVVSNRAQQDKLGLVSYLLLLFLTLGSQVFELCLDSLAAKT